MASNNQWIYLEEERFCNHQAIKWMRLIARWAKAHLDSRWAPLINAALENRLHPPRETDPAEIARTQDFIRYVLEHTGRVRVPRKDIP